jgi:hypothetical protein
LILFSPKEHNLCMDGDGAHCRWTERAHDGDSESCRTLNQPVGVTRSR